MKSKLMLIFILLFNSIISFSIIKSDFKVIESKNTLDSNSLLLDINKVSKEELLRNGVSKNLSDKMIEYREITGGFQNLKDMIRISGIGSKSYKKLKLKFKEPKNVQLKKFKINEVDDKTLKYFGFSNKEIKIIRDYQSKERIRNNVELKNIIQKNKYDKLKDLIEY